MGIISAILGWIGYHLGLRTDTADATGSLHAKVGFVADLIPTVQKPRGFAVASYTTNLGATYATALSITGRGRLLRFVGMADSTYNYGVCVKVTIDGTRVWEGRLENGGVAGIVYPTLGGYLAPSAIVTYCTAPGYVGDPIELSFKTSLLIEVKEYSTNDLDLYFLYETE